MSMLADLLRVAIRADVVIDLSAAVMLGVTVDMLVDSKIIVVTAEMFSLEFIVEVIYALASLSSELIGAIN